ncbi:selenium-dependent molybdenum cofactor biosynthesis protein YqeB [Clostridium malenominatum]|uniref:Selenium-dependent molybdenum cofactor biosynthesis protein YqeB n=1 Tax=Clostridium malenominatum TaxID=1539 RepID=A0ABP3UDI7_9CLOT
MSKDKIVVRGGGDIASGIINKLSKCGFHLLVLEVPAPTAIRRKVCYGEAVYEGQVTIEGITAIKASSLEHIEEIWNEENVPVIIDPKGDYIEKIKPLAVVDCILAKKNLGMTIDKASITVALGPGFEAGKDVHAVIETMRGHNLGKVIYKGCAMENTGVPGEIKGFSKERVIYSPSKGTIKVIKDIGSVVSKDQVIALVGDKEVRGTIDGVLRGIIRDGFNVWEGLKIADIDPRLSELDNCFTISDKARAIAGGVLEAILFLKNKELERILKYE